MTAANHEPVWTGLLWGLGLSLCMWAVGLAAAAAVGVVVG